MRSNAWLAAAGLVAVLAGCASTPTPSSIAPLPTTDGSAAGCRGADLLGPDGTRVDLTGTWEGWSSLWFVTQSGSCVTIEGLSRFGGQRDGEEYRFVVSGELHTDFSISGRWTWTWACTGPECPPRGVTKEVRLHVGFASDGGTTIEVPSAAMDAPSSFTVTLERVGPSTEFPDPG